MALLHVNFFSRTLNVASSVDVILPEAAQGIGVTAAEDAQLPRVLYLLHGYSDDQTIWQRRTSIERYAARHNLAVIMPAVNHSFYCNEVGGERYWDYVAQELPAVMHRFFRLSDRPEDTFVAGLSMGGYGAMKLALNFPERFGAAASFSGAVDILTMAGRKSGDWKRIFGRRKVEGTDCDLFHLLKANADAPRRPRLYVSCGTADYLYGHHQKFIPALKENGWDVTSYEEPDAVHEWGFWDREIAKFIPWMLGGMTVDMTRFYREEDLFPREFTGVTERPWGLLFHNEGNRDSYDSNHALLYRDRVDDLSAVLREITDFYLSRGLHPVIYQSILDDGWFGEIAEALDAAGYRSWLEEQTYMALTEPSAIVPDPAILVRRERAWQEAFGAEIFEAAGEPWEIPVVKRQLLNPGTRFFAAYLGGRPVGMIYGHVNGENVCRIDYLLVATAARGRGVGRALTHAFVNCCRETGVDCVLWPDGDTPRRIYEEAGFRYVETRFAGRASWKK